MNFYTIMAFYDNLYYQLVHRSYFQKKCNLIYINAQIGHLAFVKTHYMATIMVCSGFKRF
jgi:hypothetical protein